MSHGSDILIIGGGVIGLAIALELRSRGATITVLTRDRHQAAARAAAGMLAPHAEQLPDGPLRALGLKSLVLYPNWIQRIEELSHCDTGYWPSGILAPVYTLPSDEAGEHTNSDLPLSTLTRSASAQWLDHDAIHQAQSGLGGDVRGGWWYPDDGQVDNRALFQALWSAAEHAGVTLKEAIAVHSIQQSQGRVTGVRTSQGTYQAEQYVLATGAWAPSLLPIPVTPHGHDLGILID